MAKKIIIHLNVNEKGRKYEVDQVGVEVLLDGISIGTAFVKGTDLRDAKDENTSIASFVKEYYANPGVHAIRLYFIYSGYNPKDTVGNFTYSTDWTGQCVVEDDDVHYTINAYQCGAGVDNSMCNVAFLEGDVEMDVEKASQTKAGGCYVATCVYGSYDCPEVWTLRRYRDDTLGATWYGRAFVRLYYAISPTLVKWFGNTKWFKRLWRGKLDRMVAKLQARGVGSTPYIDKPW